MNRSLSSVALLLVTCACMGPRPQAPSAAKVVAPEQWLNSPGQGEVMTSTWWTTFNDPTLTRLVETALANSTDVAVAAARVEDARAQERIARSQRLPTLQAEGQGIRERDLSPFGYGEFQTAGEPIATASFDLDLFGRLAKADAAARASLLASKAAQETVRLAVATAAANGYITLRSLDARLAVTFATLSDRASALRFAKRRADAGYTSQLELRQAEAEYQATRQLLPQAQLAVTRQEDALRQLIGETPGPIERGAPIDKLIVPAVPSGLPSDLLRRRPDIAEAEQQLVAADHSLDSARAAFLPDIRLSGTGGAVISTLLADPVSLWSIGGSILAPIFQGGRLTAQANSAAARRDVAAFTYRKTALTAFQEVEDGLAATTRTNERLEALQAQRSLLAVTLTLATNRYNAGYAVYLDQLDAERGLLSADLNVIDAEAARLTNAVSLYQAMGGGWSSDTLK